MKFVLTLTILGVAFVASSSAETFNALHVTTSAAIGSTLTAGSTISSNNTVVAPYLQANTRLYSPGYLQIAGYSYLGSYGGDFALRVSNTDGSVIMKKAQGDILMGQFGN